MRGGGARVLVVQSRSGATSKVPLNLGDEGGAFQAL